MTKFRQATQREAASKRPVTGVCLAVCALLTVIVFVIYGQTLNFKFTNYDDQVYVTENVHVQEGLTANSVKWAFTAFYGSNWHPVSWLSHMLDWQMYGNQPGLHHLTNVLLHLLNSILLFLILGRMTGSVWRSAFVAALFAAHPLHVESVAWVAERKDVLSTFFWMMTMGAYARYARKPSIKRYIPVLLFFALGLMAKPMLVTLPFVLLLVDYWPLQRLKGNLRPMIFEKMPLIALAAASGIITYFAQQKGGSVAALRAIPIGSRIANAIVSYVAYLGRMFWPVRLAVIYPLTPEAIPMWMVAGAGLVLAALVVFSISHRKERPYFATGWFWYCGTLVPVIGLVQIGEQASADRYTYIPLIGVFIAITWLVPAMIPRREVSGWERRSKHDATAVGAREIFLAVTAIAIVFALAEAARVQAAYWQNSVTLFRHALDVTADNRVAHSNLGVALADNGRMEEAIEQYLEALRINPADADANYDYGIALDGQHRYKEAVEHFQTSLKSRPNSPRVLDNLGAALATLGDTNQAIDCFRKSLGLNPDNPKAHNNLAIVLSEQGKLGEAISEYKKAIELKPDLKEAYSNLAVALFYNADYAGAWRAVHQARKYGAQPDAEILNELFLKMPEPADWP